MSLVGTRPPTVDEWEKEQLMNVLIKCLKNAMQL